MSWFMQGIMFMTAHFKWITYPLFSKNDLISLRTTGSSSWKRMTTPSSHKYLFKKPNTA